MTPVAEVEKYFCGAVGVVDSAATYVDDGWRVTTCSNRSSMPANCARTFTPGPVSVNAGCPQGKPVLGLGIETSTW